MAKKRIFAALVLLGCIVISACNLPSGVAPDGTVGEASPTFTLVPAEAPSSTPTPAPVPVDCSPTITTNTDANVRGGPGTVYAVYGQIPQGGTAPVAGKNFDGTWWYIGFPGGPGGYGWIAGSVTTATCIPTSLAVIAAPPTPIIPTNVPSNTPVPFVPSNTPTPVIGLTFVLPPILIDPGLLFFASPTPTLFLPPCIPFPPFITCP